MNRPRSASLLARSLAPLLCFALVVFVSGTALAQSTIKQPGAHSKYSVELEPHFVLQWENRPGWSHGDGLGLGFRATIPLVDNGPISSINNNIGIGFGLDWAHYSGNCYWWFGRNQPYWYNDCKSDGFHLPVVAQWNFFLTPIISVFGEAGFGIYHWSTTWNNCVVGPNYQCDDSNTSVEFLFWGGGRFQFGANSPVSAIVRIGYPYLSAGIGIML